MELSRRDALGALSAAGIASTAGCSSLFGGGDGESNDDETPADQSTSAATPDEQKPMQTLVALGEVLYPSEAEVTAEFVGTYLMGRIADEDGYRERLATGVDTLNELARENQGTYFRALNTEQRVTLVENTDLRSGDSVPDGTPVQQVNYHLIDEMIFAFYASPVGGELVGNTNPRGWPGGFGYSPELTQ